MGGVACDADGAGLIGSRLAAAGWAPRGARAPAGCVPPRRRGPRGNAECRGPAFGGVAELGPSSALVLFALGAAHAEIVGEDADLRMQHVVPGEPEDVIDAVRLAPRHGLGTGIVAIATPADAGLGPMPTDVAGRDACDGTGLRRPPRRVFCLDGGDQLFRDPASYMCR